MIITLCYVGYCLCDGFLSSYKFSDTHLIEKRRSASLPLECLYLLWPTGISGSDAASVPKATSEGPIRFHLGAWNGPFFLGMLPFRTQTLCHEVRKTHGRVTCECSGPQVQLKPDFESFLHLPA